MLDPPVVFVIWSAVNSCLVTADPQLAKATRPEGRGRTSHNKIVCHCTRGALASLLLYLFTLRCIRQAQAIYNWPPFAV